jgi:hypothetical protein
MSLTLGDPACRVPSGMSTDATTLPLRDSPPGEPDTAERRGPPSPRWRPWREPRLSTATDARRETAIGVVILTAIVLCVALIVVAAADRPSTLSAPTHVGFFPHWLAGPLGGLWPSLTRSPQALKALFTGAMVAMYVAYLAGLKYVPRLRAGWAIGTVVAVHVILLMSPPLALTDVFNYINYGRMGVVDHLNPYTTVPVFEPHSDPSFDLSNWHGLLSPYGPLFTLITYAVVPLGLAASLWTLKSLLMVASLGTLLLVWKCARLLDRDPVQAIVLVGLNPIVLVWGLGGDHNDFLTVFMIVLGIYLLLRARTAGVVGAPGTGVSGVNGVNGLNGVNGIAGASVSLPGGDVPPTPTIDGYTAPGREAGVRAWLLPLAPLELGAGAALVTAMSLKASAGILVPAVLASLLATPRRLVQVVLGMVGVGMLLAAGSLIAFGPHLPDLGTQGRLVISVSLPNLLGLALGQGGETGTLQTILSAVLVAAVVGSGVLAWRRREFLTASGWVTIALLVTLSWVLPWYVLWVLPMAALSSSRALRGTALALGAYLILTWMPLATAMDSSLGFYPSKTPLGQLHQRYVRELLF